MKVKAGMPSAEVGTPQLLQINTTSVAEGTSGHMMAAPNGKLVISLHGIGLAGLARWQAWKDNDHTAIPRRDSFRHGLVFPP
jgi:hypothetical protein